MLDEIKNLNDTKKLIIQKVEELEKKINGMFNSIFIIVK